MQTNWKYDEQKFKREWKCIDLKPLRSEITKEKNMENGDSYY